MCVLPWEGEGWVEEQEGWEKEEGREDG